MSTEHMCDGKWMPGGVAGCPADVHGKRQGKLPRVKGIRDYKAMDKAAGVIGHDSGDGFIRDGAE